MMTLNTDISTTLNPIKINENYEKDLLIRPEQLQDIFKRAVHKAIEQNRRSEQTLEFFQRGVAIAAKLGKGTSKGGSPMVPHYWVEVINEAHGYGRDLNVLMGIWKTSSSQVNFNAWLAQLNKGENVPGKNDIPQTFFKEGELSLSNVQFLNEAERKKYEMCVDEEGLISNGHQHHPSTGDKPTYMFIVSPENQIYLGVHNLGKFHHSSFLSGGSVLGAGAMVIQKGKITKILDKSGHYEPSEAMMIQAIEALINTGTDLTDAILQMDFVGKTHLPYKALEFYRAHKTGTLDIYKAKTLYNSLPTLSCNEILEQINKLPPKGYILTKGSTEGSLVHTHKAGEDHHLEHTTYFKTDDANIFRAEKGNKLDLRDFI